MRVADILDRMINEGKLFKRDGWGTRETDAREGDPDYIFWQQGYPYPHGIGINRNTAEATGLPEGTKCFFSPYMMRHWGANHFSPYQLTQEDMVATDWEPFTRITE